MALQLSRFLDWRQDALLPASSRAPFKKNARLRRLRTEAHSGSASSMGAGSTEPSWGSNAKFSLSEFSHPAMRSPSSAVANPHYSSLLRLTRRRYHELRMETKERVFLTMSDWVKRQVDDPSVEIDPHTVNGGVVTERKTKEAAFESSSSRSFVSAPTSKEGGTKRPALIPLIVLLLVALLTAAFLASRRKKSSDGSSLGSPTQKSGISGTTANGGARKEVEDGASTGISENVGLDPKFSEMESDRAVTRLSTTTALAPQSEPLAIEPVPQYSTSLEQSELPLPPSLSSSAYTMGNISPAVDVSENFDARISQADTEKIAENQPSSSVAEDSSTADAEVGGANGVANGKSGVDFVAGERSDLDQEVPSSLDTGPLEFLVSENDEDESFAQLSDKSTADSTENLPAPDEPLAQLPDASSFQGSSDESISNVSPAPAPDTDVLKESTSESPNDGIVVNVSPDQEPVEHSPSQTEVHESASKASSVPEPDAGTSESSSDEPALEHAERFPNAPLSSHEPDPEQVEQTSFQTEVDECVSKASSVPEPVAEAAESSSHEPAMEHAEDSTSTSPVRDRITVDVFHSAEADAELSRESGSDSLGDESASAIPHTMEANAEIYDDSDDTEFYLIGDSPTLTSVERLSTEQLAQLAPKPGPVAATSWTVLLEQYATEYASRKQTSKSVGKTFAAAQGGEDSVSSSQSKVPEIQPKLAPPPEPKLPPEPKSQVVESEYQPSPEIESEAEEGERRKEYTVLFEKSLPALSIGIGAASLASFGGVGGALEVVGCIAAASVISRILWAGPRKQLVDDIKGIKDHKQLVMFLKDWNIMPQGGNR